MLRRLSLLKNPPTGPSKTGIYPVMWVSLHPPAAPVHPLPLCVYLKRRRFALRGYTFIAEGALNQQQDVSGMTLANINRQKQYVIRYV